MAGTRYRTIVADPPWPYDRTGLSFHDASSGRFTGHGLPYPSMTLNEIAALPIATLAEPDAHLYLWTTQRYLWDARDVVVGWGFRASKVLVWCKPPHGFAMGGTFGNASEFVLFCRRGTLPAKTRVTPPVSHCVLSPGPYLELFARRNRLGWDTFGNEALEHVELGASDA